MDNYYPIEVRLASKNGYHTPAEAQAYYGRYNRTGYTVHWWGDGTGASNHDNIVNYIYNQSVLGNKSVNYVLSDNKITLMVGPDNVAWCQQSGNPTDISVETQPTLGNEGYKKHGWLKAELDGRYGRVLIIHPHKYWYPTECPGSISLDRIAQEADKWKRGEYTQPAPAPTPPPPTTADLEWAKYAEGVRTFVCTKQPTNLWNFNQTSWAGFTAPIKSFNQGDEVEIVGYCTNHTINATYLLTQYSFDKKITNGINIADLTLKVQPAPPPPPPPVPPVPDQPEWVQKLRDIDDTPYWFNRDQDLIDITTGKSTGTKTFKKDEQFVSSALTQANKIEYRITDYSFKKGIYNGVPTDSLTLTPPGVPDIPPIADHPIDKNWLLAALQSLIVAIQAIINKIKG